ncbi:MAG TPA: hypothetical protein VEF04_14830, partial [Blastocatellia bacterium]|nr:hypothetical protein [Blastocatellia bacterium]
NLPGAYSYGFWLTHKRPIFGDAQSQTEAISMWGAFGTTVMISKESDLIIAAVNTSYDHSGGQVSGASLDLFAQAIIQPDIDNSLAVVNAASYSTSIAPETIASAFGTNLADGTYAASLNPLPTSLGGTVLQVNGIDAPLFYVSPTQVNFVIPAETAIGAATIKVLVNGEMRASGTANIEQVAPAIFTAAANGQGPPAGHSTFDGENHDLLTHPDGSPRPLGTGTDETPHYLILYGTGFRKASSLSAVRVIIGRVEAEVTFAGAHSYYIGLDQLNLILPRSLKTAGEVSLIVIVDSKQANEVLNHVL